MTPLQLPGPDRRDAQLLVGLGATLLVAGLWHLKPVYAALLALLPLAIGMPLMPILLFIVFSFFRIHDIFPVLAPLRLPELLAMMSLLTLGWHLTLGQSARIFLTPGLIVFGLMFAAVTFTVPFSTDLGRTLHLYQEYLKIAVMTFAIAWLVRSPGDFKLAARVFVIAGMVVAIKALANEAAGIGLVEGTRVTIGRELGSPLGDPNDLSLALLFPIAFASAMVVSRAEPRFWRFLGLVATVLGGAAILATQSRGGLLGFVAVFAVLAREFVRSKLVLAGGGGLALVVLAMAAGLADRSSGGEGVGDASSQGRLHAWVAGFRMAVAHPVTGIGMNNFHQQYFFYTPVWDGMPHVAHSTWFEMMGCCGFVAFALLVLLVANTVGTALQAKTRLNAAGPEWHSVTRAIVAGLAGFLVSGTFLSQTFTWPLYIQLALVAALRGLARRHGAAHG